MRRGHWGGLALAGAMLLAACSGDDAATTTPDTTAAPDTAVPDTTAAPDTTMPDTTAAPDTTVPDTTAAPDTTGPDDDPVGVEPRPSPGCAGAEAGPIDRIVPGTWGSQEGRYIEVLPASHDSSTPVPLVLDLHGYSSPLEAQRELSGLAAYGLDEGFAVVLPQVTRGVPLWNAAIGSSDEAFIVEILDEVFSTRCIDESRFYVAGMSNGAFMTSSLSCALSDRVAAAAPVTGLTDVPSCELSRPVPVIAFHGTADTFVAYEGGLGSSVADLPTEGGGSVGEGVVDAGGPSIEEQAAAWAARNGCADAAPAEEQLADDVVLMTWDCPPGAAVQLYRIIGGGHTWPGSPFLAGLDDFVGPTTFSIDANELIWTFFQAHPLP